ncbi:hypothetical protein [Rossellomorea sp. NS-SX7]|uniref:hypothetical protein n=1 Tax=Rossellomorea sp. NS-SX7 TaxID=3463856 RepID=UPI004059CA00
MNKGEIFLSNLVGILLVFVFSLFKAASFRKQLDYRLNSIFLNIRSFLYTIR